MNIVCCVLIKRSYKRMELCKTNNKKVILSIKVLILYKNSMSYKCFFIYGLLRLYN